MQRVQWKKGVQETDTTFKTNLDAFIYSGDRSPTDYDESFEPNINLFTPINIYFSTFAS